MIPRLAFDLLEDFNEQRLAGSIDGLPALMRHAAIARPLLVVDRRALAASDLTGTLRRTLSDYAVEEFDAFTPNPTGDQCIAACGVAARHGADGILALGGGSACDVAKVAAWAASSSDGAAAVIEGKQDPPGRPLPVVAVPTTAGSGSEATQFAAIYVRGRKRSIDDPRLRPAGVVLDYRFAAAMPAAVAAASGVDALCHGAESLWAMGSTEASRGFARAAAELLAAHLERGVIEPTGDDRRRVVLAAYLAGCAINISRTTAAHAIAYELTQRYGLVHGHAVALCLPVVAAWNAGVTDEDCQDPRGAHWVRNRVDEARRLLLGTESRWDAGVRARLAALGLAPSLGEAGVDADAAGEIAARVDPVRVRNNPRPFPPDALHACLAKAIRGGHSDSM